MGFEAILPAKRTPPDMGLALVNWRNISITLIDPSRSASQSVKWPVYVD